MLPLISDWNSCKLANWPMFAVDTLMVETLLLTSPFEVSRFVNRLPSLVTRRFKYAALWMMFLIRFWVLLY